LTRPACGSLNPESSRRPKHHLDCRANGHSHKKPSAPSPESKRLPAEPTRIVPPAALLVQSRSRKPLAFARRAPKERKEKPRQERKIPAAERATSTSQLFLRPFGFEVSGFFVLKLLLRQELLLTQVSGITPDTTAYEPGWHLTKKFRFC